MQGIVNHNGQNAAIRLQRFKNDIARKEKEI